MRKRNIHVQFWLDKKEADAFNKRVRKSGLSREAYLRHLAIGLVPQDLPSPDYYAMMREIYRVRNILEEIANTARVQKLDPGRCDEECRKLDMCIKTITDAVLLPQQMK